MTHVTATPPEGAWGGHEQPEPAEAEVLLDESLLDDEQNARVEALHHAREVLVVRGVLGQFRPEPWQLMSLAEWILKGGDVAAEDELGTDAASTDAETDAETDADEAAPTDGGDGRVEVDLR